MKLALSLYNTPVGKKQIFEPLQANNVGMYVCGPTVYDYAHIGNARPFVVFDVLYRILKYYYSSVTYVRNITDVDDKIIDAAKQSGEDIDTITERTINVFHNDMNSIANLPPNVEPAATNHIPQMLKMIDSLINLGHAYVADGHVLFSVSSMPDYGKFSSRDLTELIAGARVNVATYKKDPGDFVMWKPSENNLPGWDSPWGRGRPGWHIECSAMSCEYLGETFDIHGGGRDLIFPHHQNEVAQSTCAHNGAPLARYWLHNGFVTVSGEKMSKSLGNILTINSLLKAHSGETIRLALLSTQYRQHMDWTNELLLQSKKSLDRWYRASRDSSESEGELSESVLLALNDDLNTPAAISALHKLADSALAGSNQAAADLRKSASLLGLLQNNSEKWFHSSSETKVSEDRIESLIELRRIARKDNNYEEADRIRSELDHIGVVLEDSAEGTTWRWLA